MKIGGGILRWFVFRKSGNYDLCRKQFLRKEGYNTTFLQIAENKIVDHLFSSWE